MTHLPKLFAALCLAWASIAAAAPPESEAKLTPAAREAMRTRTPEDPKLVWTASNVVLVSQPLTPGVYAVYPDDARAKNPAGIPVATAGGFIVGDDGVLVIESMLNRRLANQMLALIRETTKKPIRYLVNTSYHGDHAYGNQFFPRDVQIVQHEKTQQYIQSHFADDVAFMSKYFGSNQGLDELKPQRAHILVHDGAAIDFDLGGKHVRVMHLGFAQTEGDLFVWLPQEKVLFTGNPIISSGSSLPWLLDGRLDDSLTTLRKLRGMLPDDAVIVPGHGHPTEVATLDYTIGYLDELQQQVGRTVQEGLPEEAAVQQVSDAMQRYAGYKLYPWVHMQINVPKTYREMSGKTP